MSRSWSEPHRFPRPRIIISRCITFEAVRYDGSVIRSGIVERMKPFVDFVPVCPEVEIGLPVPRDPIRVVHGGEVDQLVQPATGRNLTVPMEKFTRHFLDGLPAVDGFILKARSPSCAKSGVKVFAYPEADSPGGRGPGLFGRAVLDRFCRFPIEDEGRLRDARARDHFLTAVFTLARFREARERGRIQDLARFHTESRILLTAAGGRSLRAMERILADPEGRKPGEAFALYEDLILAALRRPSRHHGAERNLLPAKENLLYPEGLVVTGDEPAEGD